MALRLKRGVDRFRSGDTSSAQMANIGVRLRHSLIGMAIIGGCGGGGGSGPSGSVDEFATYWADGGASCQQSAQCGTQDEAACLALWPTVAETKAALAGTIAPEYLKSCEMVARTADACFLALTCDELMTPNQCQVNGMNPYQAGCSLVLDAIQQYQTAHPRTPFSGPFSGSYGGSESGTFTGDITGTIGAVSATITSPSLGDVPAEGAVSSSGGFSITTGGSVQGSAYVITFTGTIQAASGAGTYMGAGVWQSSSGFQGDWTLQSAN